MTFSESISSVLSNYTTSAGRASRSEYWWWTLFVFIASFGAGILDGLIGSGDVDTQVHIPHVIHQQTIKSVPGIAGKVDYDVLKCKLSDIQL